MTEPTGRLLTIDAFRRLPRDVLTALESRLKVVEAARGEALIRQGEVADTLYLVVSGRFDVTVAGRAGVVAQIGPGQAVGEIAFFSGGRRTATVTAARDSLVLALTRGDFDRLAAQTPQLWAMVTADLARRLALTNERRTGVEPPPVPKTVAVIPAGRGAIPEAVVDRLIASLGRLGRRVRTVGAEDVATALDARETTHFLNALEGEADHVIYIAGGVLTPWAEKAIRQADLVLAIGLAAASEGTTQPNAVEVAAGALDAATQHRLVLVHEHPSPVVSGTGRWLSQRGWLGMHHHVGAKSTADFDRLARFIGGQAVGLVACGGGAYTAAQVGVHEALGEAGVVFDVLGGTSGGSAMAAAFAMQADYDEILRRSADMFVQRRAMRRWTFPRYSLIDHRTFDDALAEHFTDVAIEDLWLPYFAVSTNLTDNTAVVHRSGSLWRAIRASSAIPALLPPVFTPEGATLVDGALLDNVPVGPMQALKRGPNVVIHFELPTLPRVRIDHRTLPTRWELAFRLLTRAGRARLPDAPSPQAVLLHGLTLPRRALAETLGPDDLLLSMRPPAGLTHLDWHAQDSLRSAGYAFTKDRLAELLRDGDARLAALLGS